MQLAILQWIFLMDWIQWIFLIDAEYHDTWSVTVYWGLWCYRNAIRRFLTFFDTGDIWYEVMIHMQHMMSTVSSPTNWMLLTKCIAKCSVTCLKPKHNQEY